MTESEAADIQRRASMRRVLVTTGDSAQLTACVAATAQSVVVVLDSADQAGVLSFLTMIHIANFGNVTSLVCKPGDERRLLHYKYFDLVL